MIEWDGRKRGEGEGGNTRDSAVGVTGSEGAGLDGGAVCVAEEAGAQALDAGVLRCWGGTVLAGFLGRWVWDKWKGGRTRHGGGGTVRERVFDWVRAAWGRRKARRGRRSLGCMFLISNPFAMGEVGFG